MKKLFLSFSLISLTFSLTGCANSERFVGDNKTSITKDSTNETLDTSESYQEKIIKHYEEIDKEKILYFDAKVSEFRGDLVFVEFDKLPNYDFDFSQSGGIVHKSLFYDDVRIGDYVRIYFGGSLEETVPVLLPDVYKVERLENLDNSYEYKDSLYVLENGDTYKYKKLLLMEFVSFLKKF